MNHIIVPVSRMAYSGHPEHLIVFDAIASCQIPVGNDVFR